MRQPRHDEPTWMVAQSRDVLDTGRYLGELGDLPLHANPGDWCDVVIADAEGVMRWTLVAVDCTNAVPIFAALREGGSARASRRRRSLQATCTETRGEGEVAPLSPDFTAPGLAAGTGGPGAGPARGHGRHPAEFTSTG
jgi:hypothetical protein